MSLPDGTRLLYVDPVDGGATAVRAALRNARGRAAEQGVSYLDDTTRPTPERKSRLVIDARSGLTDFDSTTVMEPGPGLDSSPVHALVAIRGLRHALPLEWQGHVTKGLSQSLEEWLASTLDASRGESAPRPWLESRQREVVERWTGRLGPDRVTVVVPCPDHLELLHVVEELAGLATGTLTDRAGVRALTHGEAEALRALNAALGATGAQRRVDVPVVRADASVRMASRAPERDEPAISLPAWAGERINDGAAELIAATNAAGVRVLGSLACLSEGPADSAGESPPDAELPSVAAALLALGIVDAIGLGREGGARAYIEPRELAGISAYRLIAAIAARPARALGALRLDRRRGAGTGSRADARTPASPADSDRTGRRDQVAASQMTLPPGTRLLHIGPSKTGTTALQASLDRARDAALQQGVRYVGWRRHARAAVLEATGKPSRHPIRATREWQDILGELRTATEARTVFSSEELAHADSEFIRDLLDEVGAADVHIVVTLRPLARILPSAWQEGVKSGAVTPFEAWLRRILLEPDSAPAFWQRQRHDALIRRWAAVAGIEHVTAIVVDDRDPSSLPRAFEGLLGLRPGTLQLHRDLSNRSLTLGEIEAVRALNELLEQEGRGRDFRRVVVGMGVSYRMRLRDPDPDEARISLPPWAEDTVVRIAHDMIEGIATSGVHVIGDLSTLTGARGKARRSSNAQATPNVPAAAAAAMAMGVLEAGGLLDSPSSSRAAGAPREARDWIGAKLAIIPARELGRVVGRRVRRSGAALARRAAGSVARGIGRPG